MHNYRQLSSQRDYEHIYILCTDLRLTVEIHKSSDILLVQNIYYQQ